MKNSLLATLLFCLAANVSQAQTKIKLVQFATGFTRPVDITHCGDSRLFVVEQTGKIWILDSLGNRLPNPFLDIDARVNSTGNEQGLLGLTFHPNYSANGFFYVNYTDNAGDTKVSRFTRTAANPNLADADSELVILTQDQPYANHNGGCLKFGNDGMLYISFGDGGSGGDPQNNGQTKSTFLGKILRIDVNSGNPYAVPSDNPFVNDPAFKPEIWVWGVRNVWRFSVDRLTGDFWLGDVGQGAREEIDFIAAGVGGKNFGWRCYEGTNVYNSAGCGAAANYEPPVFEYANPSIGCSVTGGFVYRGSKYPNFQGKYFFADYCSGRFWTVERQPNGSFVGSEIANLDNYQFSTFGDDRDGELYVAMLSTGRIMKMVDACAEFKIIGEVWSETCVGALNGGVDINQIQANGSVNYLWSNGSTNQNLGGVSGGKYSVTATDGIGCVKIDSFQVPTTVPPPAPQLASNFEICEGDTLVLTAPPAPIDWGYSWFKNGQLLLAGTPADSSLTITKSGNYQVQLVSFTNCKSDISDTAKVVVLPTPDPLIFQISDSLFTIEPGNAFQWFLNGDPIAGAISNYWNAQNTGFHTVRVENEKCAGLSAPVFVEVSAVRLPAEISHFRLSPNPTAAEVFLEIDFLKNVDLLVQLTDAAGKVLLFENLAGQQIRRRFDFQNLPSGSYFFHFQSVGTSFSKQVFKN